MSCKLTVLGHASFLLEDSGLRLLIDPWFFGKVFNDGWCLNQEVDLRALDIESITHVYITHEHPDHFHIPTLFALRKRCDPIFLFQETLRTKTAQTNMRAALDLGLQTLEGEKNMGQLCVEFGRAALNKG